MSTVTSHDHLSIDSFGLNIDRELKVVFKVWALVLARYSGSQLYLMLKTVAT